MTCVWCRRRSRSVVLVPLPLTGQLVALCNRCRGPRFIAHMAGLVAHG